MGFGVLDRLLLRGGGWTPGARVAGILFEQGAGYVFESHLDHLFCLSVYILNPSLPVISNNKFCSRRLFKNQGCEVVIG